MATAIEDAGFEIRDMIAWVYGSGFPKSLDVSKAIDKAAGAEREVVSANPNHRPNSGAIAAAEWFQDRSSGLLTAPATEAAKQWAGWGTALKPSLEPITVARKPLCGTVAENVLQYGTGGLNVDGCRVGTESTIRARGDSESASGWASVRRSPVGGSDSGRWPANLIHDGSNEVVGLFPETEPAKRVEGVKRNGRSGGIMGVAGAIRDGRPEGHDDSGGSAARFFYCAKADASERRNSKHPTIKPVALMRYLVRLVTPPGGLVLDPFGGSGTTAEAARLEHCRFLLMELNPEYCADAAERLRQGVLF